MPENNNAPDRAPAGTVTARLALALPQLTKAVFSQPAEGQEDTKITVRPFASKQGRMYQLERFAGNKAFHENLSGDALLDIVGKKLDGRYRQVLIVTGTESSQFVLKRDGSYRRTSKAAVSRPGDMAAGHNRAKGYILAEGENIPALVDLGVFTPDFKVVASKYDKYRQINRFVELVDNEFSGSGRKEITILDFGCGKSYLTFILYYYFTVKKGIDANIIGYDLKTDVVEHCNEIAHKYGYDKLKFYVADVTRDRLYDMDIDMVVTLHACDTATDYALHYAMLKNAEYIFSVPCCQHEINLSIGRGGDFDMLLKYGIIKERFSALLTDAIRANVLEDSGYSVDMIEFVDMEHSPKNIMIRARKNGRTGSKKISEARRLADSYGFTQKLLDLVEADRNTP